MKIKNWINQITGQKGFSLVETMVGVGLMAGVGLMVSQIVSQADKVKVSSESNTNSIATVLEIQKVLTDSTACKNTFQNKMVSDPITEIRNKKNDIQFVVGTEYSKSVRLSNIALSRSGTETIVTVSMEKIGNKRVGIASQTMRKMIPINAQYDGAGRITGCQSDVLDNVALAAENAVEEMCRGMNLTYDAVNRRCYSNPQLGTNAAPLVCGTNQTLVSFVHSGGTYTTSCVDTLGMSGTCTADQLLRRNADSTFSCVDIKCPNNGMFLGLNTDGSPNCLTCGDGTLPMFVNGVLGCNRPYCNNPGGSLQTYMAGIDSSGNAICNNLVDPGATNCANSQLVVGASGEVKFQCCTPDCSNAANNCQGRNFPSANGCGVCTGTKPPTCNDPQSTCVGNSYPSTAGDGCGTCPGAKLPTSGTWSAWSACSGNVQTRTCDNNVSCGGAQCSGPSVQNCGCTAAISCATIKAGVCSNISAGVDSCGVSCGMGTKAPTTSCADIAAGVCTSSSAGFDSCGNSCGMGTMSCGGGGGQCEWDPGPTPFGDPACDPVGSPILSGACTNISDCPSRPPSAVGCPTQPYTLLSCGGVGGGTTTGGGGGGCFIAGTPVSLFDGSSKNIEDVIVGDSLLGSEGEEVKVISLLPKDYQGEVFSINGGEYFFTPNHPFKSLKGWIAIDPVAANNEVRGLDIKSMGVGDILIKRDSLEIIYSLDSMIKSEKVYNFEVSGKHEYIAMDYVVHNKLDCACMSRGLTMVNDCASLSCSGGRSQICDDGSQVGSCDGGGTTTGGGGGGTVSCTLTMMQVAGAMGCSNGNIYEVNNNGSFTGTYCTHYPDTDYYDGFACAVNPNPTPSSDCPVGSGCPASGI